jgi:hypothetical protein
VYIAGSSILATMRGPEGEMRMPADSLQKQGNRRASGQFVKPCSEQSGEAGAGRAHSRDDAYRAIVRRRLFRPVFAKFAALAERARIATERLSR